MEDMKKQKVDAPTDWLALKLAKIKDKYKNEIEQAGNKAKFGRVNLGYAMAVCTDMVYDVFLTCYETLLQRNIVFYENKEITELQFWNEVNETLNEADKKLQGLLAEMKKADNSPDISA